MCPCEFPDKRTCRGCWTTHSLSPSQNGTCGKLKAVLLCRWPPFELCGKVPSAFVLLVKIAGNRALERKPCFKPSASKTSFCPRSNCSPDGEAIVLHAFRYPTAACQAARERGQNKPSHHTDHEWHLDSDGNELPHPSLQTSVSQQHQAPGQALARHFKRLKPSRISVPCRDIMLALHFFQQPAVAPGAPLPCDGQGPKQDKAQKPTERAQHILALSTRVPALRSTVTATELHMHNGLSQLLKASRALKLTFSKMRRMWVNANAPLCPGSSQAAICNAS